MKTRNGFVSNSSSSSFLILGMQGLPSAEVQEVLEGLREDGDFIIDEDYGVCGEYLGRCGEGDYGAFKLGDLNKRAAHVSEILGIPVEQVEVIIYESYS